MLFNSAKALFIFLFLSSCSSEWLRVRTEYVSVRDFASFYVGTPDPLLNQTFVGQRLFISWAFPKKFLRDNNLHLDITIRFKNREEINQSIILNKNVGTYIFSHLNDDYCEKGGILTYKVDLASECGIIKEWRHQLWANLIQLNNE